MAALWNEVPGSQRGAYAETSVGLPAALEKTLRPGDTVLVKGSNGAKMSVVIEALKARAANNKKEGG
jgi:UDP-N-acetylmuramoyl-tripeptide--D-alanyl-D-alanine ligase